LEIGSSGADEESGWAAARGAEGRHRTLLGFLEHFHREWDGEE